MKRLFLSYSVSCAPAGREFIRRLFDRLRQQELDPWIFESPRGEIRTGALISLECRRKIEESDIFLVYVDEAALQSDFVAMEVSHALWEAGRRALPIVPLIVTPTPTREWAPALAEAAGFKGITLPADPLDATEAVIIHVCERMDLAYAPPAPARPRLPLRQRLAEELGRRQPLSAYPAGELIALLRKADVAVEALTRDDYQRARRVVEGILIDLELQYELARAYYPRIVLGTIMMAEAQAGHRPFEEVKRFFDDLIAEEEGLDANVFAARGNVLMALGRYEEALSSYLAAEPYLEAPDAALFYNIVRARVFGGLAMDRGEVDRRAKAIEEGMVTRIPGDLSRLMSCIALAYAYIRDVEAAVTIWAAIGDIQAVFPELVVDVASQLHRHGVSTLDDRHCAAARSIISGYLDQRGDLTEGAVLAVRQIQARLMFDCGERVSARRQLAALVVRFPAAPVLALDAAMYALAEGDLSSARRLCQATVSLTDASLCDPPLSQREFNLALGHAFWLLGRRSEASESFRRSHYPPAMWYDATMPGSFGSAA